MMKLRTFLESEHLLPFLAEHHLKKLNYLKLDSYIKVENGFEITANKKSYKILLEKHKTYTGNDPQYQLNTYCYEKGRMGFLMNPMTKVEPKVIIAIGTALMNQYRATLDGRLRK